MSFLDNFKKKATDAVKKNPDKAKQGLDKATDFLDKRTHGKYTDKLNKVDEQGGNAIDKTAGTTPASSQHPEGGSTPHDGRSA